MKCMYKNRLGKSGELMAKKLLSEKHYKFVAANYRYERVEIDLIFEDEKNKMLIFAEVKTRRNEKYGLPEESVTISKQNNIRKAALGFVNNFPQFSNHDMRIDVVSILIAEEKVEINHIENAF